MKQIIHTQKRSGSRAWHICASIAAGVLFLLLGGLWFNPGKGQDLGISPSGGAPSRPRMIGSLGQNNANTEPPKQQTKPSGGTEPLTQETEAPFYAALRKRGIKLDGICAKDDPVARRILEDYGAIFIGSSRITPPPVCMFLSEAEVLKFQEDVKFGPDNHGGAKIELQIPALLALLEARTEANQLGLDITPRGGSEAARRSYGTTLRLWNSRFFPALAHWEGKGRISSEQASRLRNLPIHDQVREVLELEKSGLFFSTGFDKSILYSVAAPGTSQHISMLALDVAQFGDPRVRQILARHGWFQTVKSDLPHFTYLGLEEKDLPLNGLKPVKVGAQTFWIPNVDSSGH